MPASTARRWIPGRRWTRLLWIAALTACLFQALFLSREVLRDLDGLSSAPIDDVRWTLSQTEVELLRMILALRDAADDPSDLSNVRRRFDVFYGRIDTLATSKLFASFRTSAGVVEELRFVRDFLDRGVTSIDGPDSALAADLPRLTAGARELIPHVRELALAGIPVFAEAADRRRLGFMQTLQQLAIVSVALIGGLALSLLILQRVHRRAKLASAEREIVRRRFEAAITSSLDAVFVIDTWGRVIEANGAAETIFGYPRQDMLGRPVAEMIIPPGDREEYWQRLERFRSTGEAYYAGKGRLRMNLMRQSGKVFPAEVSVSEAQSDEQEVFVTYIRDITADLAAEQELRDAHDRARAGDEAKTRLLTVMSHEMRTPLNGILGSLELIRRDDLSDRQKRLLAAIGTSGELLLSHVNNVLDLSRLDSDRDERRPESFDLDKLVERLTDSLRPTAQARGNDLEWTVLDGPVGAVRGDKRALQQCLVNLIGNAIKFTRDGTVSVEIERLNGGAEAEFRISDTGLGIPADRIGTIFDEFVTIDTDYARENPGTGLGLAITRKLIAAMGGQIEVDSIEGEGSLFTFRIPLPATAAPGEGAAHAPLASLTHSKHVLIVEDNDVNRMILQHMLDELGCTHESAHDGDAGIALARQGRFDLMLLDISMPGKDGIQTLAEIRALENAPSASARAIAITAHARREDRDRILKTFDDIVIKPISLARLAERIGDGGNAQDGRDDVAADFIARFGRDAFRRHLQDLQAGLALLLDTLAGAPGMEQADRDAAHKLAGSAAVLGQTGLRLALQRLERLDDDRWQADGSDLLTRLERESAAISASQDASAAP